MQEKNTITLEEKVKKYEGLLESIINNASGIGTIVAGPFIEKGTEFYRVNVGTKQVVLPTAKIGSEIFKILTEVQVSEREGKVVAITRALPQELTIVKTMPQGFKPISWSEIGGLKSQVKKIQETVELPLTHANLLKEFGMSPMKGLALIGPPGCGKTLLAKVIASKIIKKCVNDPRCFVYVKGAEWLSKYVGVAEAKIKEVFQQSREFYAETGTRAVIFIDEAEALLPTRGSRISSDVESTLVPMFLSEMDGFDDHSPFIVLSTNLVQNIDPAILREGRIDVHINVERPNEEDAAEIFRIHLEKILCVDKKDLLAESASKKLFITDKLRKRVSGAMIETICKSATQLAISRFINNNDDKKGVTEKDLLEAIENLN